MTTEISIGEVNTETRQRKPHVTVGSVRRLFTHTKQQSIQHINYELQQMLKRIAREAETLELAMVLSLPYIKRLQTLRSSLNEFENLFDHYQRLYADNYLGTFFAKTQEMLEQCQIGIYRIDRAVGELAHEVCGRTNPKHLSAYRYQGLFKTVISA